MEESGVNIDTEHIKSDHWWFASFQGICSKVQTSYMQFAFFLCEDSYQACLKMRQIDTPDRSVQTRIELMGTPSLAWEK